VTEHVTDGKDIETGDERLDARPIDAAAEHIRVAVAIALGGEHDALAVGGKGCIVIERRCVEKFALAASVRIGGVEAVGKR
jgi:sensor histidine kinase regulating citrate/malate metabolism